MSQPIQIARRTTRPAFKRKLNTGTGTGTMGPSTSSKSTTEQQRKLLRLRIKSSQLSRNVAKCEGLYHKAGEIFFYFPLAVRDELLTDENVKPLFISADEGKDPKMASSLAHLRSLRDELRDALRRHDIEEAASKFRTADDFYDDVKDELLGAHSHLVNKRTAYFANYPRDCFSDEGLPYFPFSAEGFAPKYVEAKRWVRSLPEVKRAVEELGLLTVEQAFYQVLGVEEEEHFLDDDGLEFSDMESIASEEDEDEDEEDGGVTVDECQDTEEGINGA